MHGTQGLRPACQDADSSGGLRDSCVVIAYWEAVFLLSVAQSSGNRGRPTL